MEAQEDQHRQARPELSGHVENMEDYDTVILGYPNWWASIPMPIASFLEEYDFTGKQIIPFCSHGGGRFGQSLTKVWTEPDSDRQACTGCGDRRGIVGPLFRRLFNPG